MVGNLGNNRVFYFEIHNRYCICLFDGSHVSFCYIQEDTRSTIVWEYTRITSECLLLWRSQEITVNRDPNNIRMDIYWTDKILRFSRNIITLVQPLLCLENSPKVLDVLLRHILWSQICILKNLVSMSVSSLIPSGNTQHLSNTLNSYAK